MGTGLKGLVCDFFIMGTGTPVWVLLRGMMSGFLWELISGLVRKHILELLWGSGQVWADI